jgi:hypothetical protein
MAAIKCAISQAHLTPLAHQNEFLKPLNDSNKKPPAARRTKPQAAEQLKDSILYSLLLHSHNLPKPSKA